MEDRNEIHHEGDALDREPNALSGKWNKRKSFAGR